MLAALAAVEALVALVFLTGADARLASWHRATTTARTWRHHNESWRLGLDLFGRAWIDGGCAQKCVRQR